jgi:AcrR family transcriptional regulator
MPEVKPRNASSTRATILMAARSLFAQNGYDGISLRDIASKADCNVALISRYFGNKDQLFHQAVSEGFNLSDIASSNRQDFGQNMAHYILSKRQRGALEPLQALLRSTSNLTATALIHNILESQFITPLAQWLGGENAKARAATIAAIIIGIATTHDILESPSLTKLSLEKKVEMIAPILQALIDV